MKRDCEQCKKEFLKPDNCSKKDWATRKFCSKHCAYQSRNIGRTIKICPTCKKEFTGAYKLKKYCSLKCRPSDYWLGKKRSADTIEKVSKSKKGKHSNPANEFKKGHKTRNKGIEYTAIKKQNHWNWKGGLTDINKKIRNSVEYNGWRKAVRFSVLRS